MTDHIAPEPVHIQLTAEEMSPIVAVVEDSLAVLEERVRRFARPEEREHLAGQIDPETAQVFFIYAETLDPYGDGVVEPEHSCIGREYFAVDPEVGVAVLFYDLPEQTRDALEPKRRQTDAEGWRRIWEITNS